MATIVKRKGKGPGGADSWQVRVRVQGHVQHTETFVLQGDAKTWAAQAESGIKLGKCPECQKLYGNPELGSKTVRQLADRYKAEVEKDPAKVKAGRVRQIEWWGHQLGNLPLSLLSPPRIAECRDKLKQRGFGPATVNRYLGALSRALTLAATEWGWLEHSPMRKVRRFTEPPGRVRFLSDDERERLLDACKRSTGPTLYPIVVLALSTGMRKGEIRSLTWDQVDLKRGWITLDITKNRERRGVPLSGFALEVMRKWAKVRRIDTPLTFPNATGNGPTDFDEAWVTARTVAMLDNFRFHDLRHTAASYLAMNGATAGEIAAVLGHKTLAMVKRYAHLSDAHVAGVVERMNAKMFGSRAGE